MSKLDACLLLHNKTMYHCPVAVLRFGVVLRPLLWRPSSRVTKFPRWVVCCGLSGAARKAESIMPYVIDIMSYLLYLSDFIRVVRIYIYIYVKRYVCI